MSSFRPMVVAVPVAALLLIGTTMARQATREQNPAAVVKATNPIVSLPASTDDTLAPTVLSTAAPTTAPTTTEAPTTVARNQFSLGTPLPMFPMTATAWVLEPSPETEAIRQRVGAALDTKDATLFTLTDTTWRYEVPAATMPVPFLCTKLDLQDPLTFLRCQEERDRARVEWRGGDHAVADARALWTRMGYDLRDYAVQPALDRDGYAVAHLLLGGQPVRYGLRVRFEDGRVQAAEGLTVAARHTSALVISTAEAVTRLQATGFVEMRDNAGGIDVSDTAAWARATIVDAEPALVGVDGEGTDERLYAVPGFAFVAADGTRFVVPALAVAPDWDAPASDGSTGG